MPFLASQGRELYYERHGHGPAVVFLHGAGSNAATWWQQLPVFTPSYTCLTLDLRCFGRSVAPLEEFALPNFVGDVRAMLDAERIDRAVIIGQSLGGMVGLRLALAHPDRVSALVACDSSMAVDHPLLVESVRRRFETAPAVGIEQRSLGRWFLQQQPALAVLYAQINHFNPSAHRIDGEDWRRALLRLNEPDQLLSCDALEALACPTLFLVGEDDPIVPVAALRDLQDRVQDSELVVVAQAAHSAYFERADVFNRCVRDFIARRVPGPAGPALPP